MYGDSRGVYRVLVEKPKETDQLRDPGVDGRIILRWIFRNGGKCWIELAQYRFRWRAFVNAVMNFGVP
jgi:hypothetical protein